MPISKSQKLGPLRHHKQHTPNQTETAQNPTNAANTTTDKTETAQNPTDATKENDENDARETKTNETRNQTNQTAKGSRRPAAAKGDESIVDL